MDISHIDFSGVKNQQSQKNNMVKETSLSFKDQLMSKVNFIPGSIVAAENTHKQSLMKARSVTMNSHEISDDEESILGIIKEIKRLIRSIRHLEKDIGLL